MPGMWKFSKDYIPTKPSVYFNLFNNQWSTNYRFWNEGKWTYRFRVWSYDQYDAEASLITPSLEMRYPVQTAAVDAPAGKLPKTQAGLSVSRPGVLVTAFGDNPDGEGTILRVWEQAGNSGELTATIPGNFKTATPVSLRGEKTGEPIPLKGGKLTINLGAYAPASFVLAAE
jgi:alpha-mannosidase